MFGSSLSPLPLVGGGGGVVCESLYKADLLSDHFDRKLSIESVDLLLTFHPFASLPTFAVRSSGLERASQVEWAGGYDCSECLQRTL